MPLTSLLPVGGAALGMLAARTLTSLADGFSFKSQLARSVAEESEAKVNRSAEPRVSLNLSETLTSFVLELRDRFQEAGVDLTQPFTLKEDGNGSITVEGDHPDRSTIEQILAEDPKLAAQFQEIALAATERRRSIPLAIDNPFGEFRLSFAGGTAAVRFE